MDAAGESGASEASDGVDLRAYLYVALMVVIGSTTAPAARYAVRELPVGLVPLLRFSVAGLCLLPVVGRRGGDLARIWREDRGRLALAAFLCIPINQTFFLNATRLTATSHVALIYAAVPLVVLLLAALLGQERLRSDRVAAVGATVLGVMVIGLDGLVRRGASAGAGLDPTSVVRGDLLLVGAVVSWGAYLTVSKPLVARHGALATLAATFLLGALMEVPIALLARPDWTRLQAASPAAWYGLAYLTLFVTVFALLFQNLALRRLDASQVATFGNAAPLLTVLWGVWLFGETVTPALALGGALTLGGIVWTGRPAAARRGPALDRR